MTKIFIEMALFVHIELTLSLDVKPMTFASDHELQINNSVTGIKNKSNMLIS